MFCSVNKLVPDIAVSGADGGVKVVVYTAVPLTIRTSVTYALIVNPD